MNFDNHDEPQLKRCPFCGSDKVYIAAQSPFDAVQVRCSCGSRGPAQPFEVVDEGETSRLTPKLWNKAAEAWNARAPLSEGDTK